MYARVERIVRLARGHVEARGEEALVGDAHLQILDVGQGFALFYQVIIRFHVGSNQTVLGERTLKRQSPLNSPRGGALAYHGDGSGSVVRIFLVRFAIGHVAVREDKDFAEVVGVVVAAVPVPAL